MFLRLFLIKNCISMHSQVFISILFIITFTSCKNYTTSITRMADYEKYMNIASADSMNSLQHIKADIDFWQKRLNKNAEDAVSKVSLAGLYTARFKTIGNIYDIHTSDSLYTIANYLFKTSSSSIYRSLASNCVTQHKFQQARLYLDTALKMGDDLYLTLLMKCDVALEPGDLFTAEQA